MERFVTSTALPAYLSSDEAEELVTARVERLLKPWREQLQSERESVVAQQRIDDLIRQGELIAYRATQSWDRGDREEARADVSAALREEVEEEWTHGDVQDLVDEMTSDDDEEDDD